MRPSCSGWRNSRRSSPPGNRNVDGTASLTVLFEAPFWVGLYERWEQGHYTVCKITFGAEPKDAEVYGFLLEHWRRLVFSPALPADQGGQRRVNPKRMQREIHARLQNKGVGTKAQQALQLQREEHKLERKAQSREQREAEKQRQFALRQEKKKARHKGH